MKSELFGTDFHMLSYCWCDDLIKSSFSSGDLCVPNVHSNCLVYEESISTGNMMQKMESPMDKLRDFNDITRDSKNDSKPLTVYIGGSVGEFAFLARSRFWYRVWLEWQSYETGESMWYFFCSLILRLS